MIVLRDIRRVDSVVLAFGLVVIQHVVEQELDLAIGNVTSGEADAPKLRDLAQPVETVAGIAAPDAVDRAVFVVSVGKGAIRPPGKTHWAAQRRFRKVMGGRLKTEEFGRSFGPKRLRSESVRNIRFGPKLAASGLRTEPKSATRRFGPYMYSVRIYSVDKHC
jgi:ribosomal protein L35